MATTTKSVVGSATSNAVNTDWLNVDKTPAERGQGPAEYGYPGNQPPPVVPVGTNPLPLDQPEFAEDSAGYQVDPEGYGAWPSLPADYNGWQRPLQRPEGPPQGTYESLVPSEAGSYTALGAWTHTEPLQTWDAISQNTDTEGWRVNVPNDRTSHRNQWGQANPLNVPTWYPYGERPARQHIARVATGFTTDNAQFGVIGQGNGALPDWSMTGGQGNTVYETPGPPATTPTSQGTFVPDQTAGWA